MRKVPLGRMEGFARAKPAKPLPHSITRALAGWALSQHVQQFVLASEGSLWQVLIPALGSSPSGEAEGRGERPPLAAPAPPQTLSIPKQQLCVIPTQRGGHC